MTDIPPQLRNRLQATLQRCGSFDRDATLRAVFSDARISVWHDEIPQINVPAERVRVTIDHLREQHNAKGENALVLFLRVLSDQTSPADALYQELTQLADELERASTHIGKYKLLGEIGHGQFAIVYKAHDTQSGRIVALKVLRPQFTVEERVVELFRREAHQAKQLDHPHVAVVYGLTMAENKLCIAQELAETTLAAHLDDHISLSPEDALPIVEQLADALDYIHAQKLIHRDIKPSNILINSQKRILLGDFGLAKAIEASRFSRTLLKDGAGTPAYIAPEIWDGDKPTPAVDIYALGCVIYRMLTGHPLFAGDSSYHLMKLHHEAVQHIARVQDVSPIFKLLLIQTLERDPAHRYTSAGELARVFRAAVQAEKGNSQAWLAWLDRQSMKAIRQEQWERARRMCQEYERVQPGNPKIAGLLQAIEVKINASDEVTAAPSELVSPVSPRQKGLWKWVAAIIVAVLGLVVVTLGLLGVLWVANNVDWQALIFGTATPTMTISPTQPPTPTYTPTPTDIPTPTHTPTDTPIPSPTPTFTPRPTNTPSPTDTPEPTNTPSPTPLPTPNPGLGTFTTSFDNEEIMWVTHGLTMGSESLCAFHNLHLVSEDVGKELRFAIIDNASTVHPDSIGLTLYRSYIGPNESGIDVYGIPNAEYIEVTSRGENYQGITWVISAAGDYILCLEASGTSFSAYDVQNSVATYNVILISN